MHSNSHLNPFFIFNKNKKSFTPNLVALLTLNLFSLFFTYFHPFTFFLIFLWSALLYICRNIIFFKYFVLSTNKFAIIRYQTLDKCFRNTGRNYDIEILVEECNKSIYDYSGKEEGIKKRQVYDDIRFMESEQGWSIDLKKVKEGRRVYYKYQDSTFSISNQPLNETEANQLREALLTLNRFKGLPQYNWINEINARLESSFNLKQKEEIIISFEQNEYLRGLEFIPELYNAILYKKVIRIVYKSFNSDEAISITTSPYYLKQYNMRWFLFGQSEIYTKITNLALDRIENIEVVNQDYTESVMDFNEYFEDVIGVTIPSDKIQDIVLKVDKTLISYITTKPLHGSQKIKEIGNNFEVYLKLIPNYELETLILSLGEKIQVLEPIILVEKIKDRINKMINNY